METLMVDDGRPKQAPPSLWMLPLRIMQCAESEELPEDAVRSMLEHLRSCADVELAAVLADVGGRIRHFVAAPSGASSVEGCVKGREPLQCACGRLLRGERPDGAFLNARGSLKINNTEQQRALADASPELGLTCLPGDIASAAVFPLWGANRRMGVLMLADSRPDRFPFEKFEFLEQAAGGVARVMRWRLEQGRRESFGLASVLSYEMRTPANALLGLVQMAAGAKKTEEVREYVGMAGVAAEELLHRMDVMLNIFRLAEGSLKAETKPFAPSGLAAGAARATEPKAADRQLKLRYRLDPEIPSVLMGDESLLKVSLVNLLEHCLERVSQGEVGLDIVLLDALTEESAVDVRFKVWDTGPAIDRERALRLLRMDPVTRAMGPVEETADIGLALAARLVEAMGGELRLSSPPRLGLEASFSLRFDRAPGDAADSCSLDCPSPGAVASDDERVRSVLVAEDNLISCRMIDIFLRKQNFRPVCVENGVLALRALARERFDLVLMDVQMPEMDGLTAAQRIREGAAGEGNRDVPIIAMTAHVLGDNKESYLNAGMDGYAAKPVDLASLARLIEEVLAARGRANRGTKLATAEAEATGSLMVLDRVRLLQRYQGDRTLVNELYQAFMEDGPARLQLLRSSLEAADLGGLAKAAHSLKGMLGVVFANKAMKLAAELQDAALVGRKGASGDLTERLCAALDEVFEELRRGVV